MMLLLCRVLLILLLWPSWRALSLQRPDSVLAFLGNVDVFNLTVCSWSFSQHDAAVSTLEPIRQQSRMPAHTCTRHCLRALNASDVQAPRVYGSFPYHPASSICLAAIHSGAITDAAGGAVLVERAYPFTWSNDSQQTLFPHASHQASLSNGVQSLEVPLDWRPLPAHLHSFSFTVRSRGVVAVQRQTAPFSPRSGHLHLKFIARPDLYHHLVIGGYDGSRYLNDVWHYQSFMPRAGPLWRTADNGRWRRLADAPFSPRSDMLAKRFYLTETWSVFSQWWPQEWEQLISAQSFVLVGGQTRHACNNVLLGICSTEVWQLNVSSVNVSAEHPFGVSVVWSQQPVDRLPFRPRCGAALLHDGDWKQSSSQYRLLGLAGGQLSYDEDSSCSAAIETTNEAWYSSANNSGLQPWRQGRAAPFSPRRSMQEEAAFVRVQEPAFAVDRWAYMHGGASVNLVGGIAYRSHRYNRFTRTAVLSSAEIYADAWSCTLPNPDYQPEPVECDWSASFTLANLSSAPPSAPSASLPVPLAHAAHWAAPGGLHEHTRGGLVKDLQLRFGGVSSREARRLWLSKPASAITDAFSPLDAAHAALLNLSVLQQPVPALGLQGVPQMTAEDRSDGLPLRFLLDEDELNAPDSDFALGSEAVISHHAPDGDWNVWPVTTTLHFQSSQMAEQPEDATVFLPQAASSVNTTRGLLNFRMRRIGHAVDMTSGAITISGGHSGGVYSSDWITQRPFESCLWPDDPSYAPVLGPVRVLGLSQQQQLQWRLPFDRVTLDDSYSIGPLESALFMPGAIVRVACAAGHHWSPPLEDRLCTLSCMPTGLWLDLSLSSVRRCVADELWCVAPFADSGYSRCLPPLPVVHTMRVVATSLYQRPRPGVSSGPTEMADLPAAFALLDGTLRLIIEGEWLSEPLLILVNTQPCRAPQLLNTSSHCSDGSASAHASSSGSDCLALGTVITCFIDKEGFVPTQMVSARIGRRGTVVSMVPSLHGVTDSSAPLRLDSRLPRIFIHNMKGCVASRTEGGQQVLQYVDCPDDALLSLEICVLNTPFAQIFFPSLPQPQALYVVDGSSDPYGGLRCDRLDDLLGNVMFLTNIGGPDPLCDSRIPQWRCMSLQLCTSCTLRMHNTSHTLAYRYPPQPEFNNFAQIANATTAPTLTVRDCRAGFLTNDTAAALNFSQRCQPCPAGQSSISGQRSCFDCPRGQYSPEPASAACSLCSPGHYAPDPGSTECLPCGLNRWQANHAADHCNDCDDGQYVVKSSVEQPGRCLSCPDGAVCSKNGTLLAGKGAFLLITQDTGTLSTADCGVLACVDAAEDSGCRQVAQDFSTRRNDSSAFIHGVQRVRSSGLGVINCCGENRLPSVDAEGTVNVLCSACLPGFIELSGRCVQCSEAQWGVLAAAGVLGLLLVYLLHRLTRAETGAATLSILIYGLQMSSLFLTLDWMPHWLSLLVADINLDGSGITGQCVMPMHDYGKILTRALSPVTAVLLAGMLLSLQLSVRAAVNAASRRRPESELVQRMVWLYKRLLPAAHLADTELRTEADRVAPAASSALQPLTRPLLADAEPTLELQRRPPASLVQSQQPADAGDAVGNDVAAVPAWAWAAAAAALTGTADSVRSVCAFYRHTLVLLLLFSYNSLTTLSLACLHSRPVGEYGDRLWQYPSIEMSTPQYQAVAALMIALLVVAVIGCPVALLLYLSWLRHRGQLAMPGAANEDEAGGSCLDSGSLAAVLTRSYAPRFWYWTVVILMRRLTLIVVLTFAQAAVYSWLTLLNQLYLALHLTCWPYRHRRDNLHEALTLLALALQTVVMTAYPSWQQRPPLITAALLGLVIVPFMVGAAMGVTDLHRRCRRQQQEDRQLHAAITVRRASQRRLMQLQHADDQEL